MFAGPVGSREQHPSPNEAAHRPWAKGTDRSKAWHSDEMGYGYDAICRSCGTRFAVSEGPGMVAMPFHCDQCGKEWWWKFGPGGPTGKEAAPPPCECGGTFREDASPRCPNCRSAGFVHDPEGSSMIYD